MLLSPGIAAVVGWGVTLQVNLYGFHVHPSMGALYHYYNPADEPANAQRDDGEWDLVRKLVEGGFVHFAEPCIVECHDGQVRLVSGACVSLIRR